MWVGLSGTLASGLLALVVGRMTDLVYGYIKLTLLVFLAINLAFFYWFFLLSWGSITVTTCKSCRRRLRHVMPLFSLSGESDDVLVRKVLARDAGHVTLNCPLCKLCL